MGGRRLCGCGCRGCGGGCGGTCVIWNGEPEGPADSCEREDEGGRSGGWLSSRRFRVMRHHVMDVLSHRVGTQPRDSSTT